MTCRSLPQAIFQRPCPKRTPQIINPAELWVRCDGAFEPVVPRDVSGAAARVRRFNEKTYLSHEEILRALGVVVKREGKLTTFIINTRRICHRPTPCCWRGHAILIPTNNRRRAWIGFA